VVYELEVATLAVELPHGSIAEATTIRRKRGPSLSRRVGQKGNVFQHSKPWSPVEPAYGRFWVDVSGQNRQRKTVSLGVCRTRSIARQKLREHIDSSGVNNQKSFTATIAPGTTFRQQAESWIESLSKRRRKPVKPATIQSWRSCVDKWLLPNLGDRTLSEVANAALKDLVEKMALAGLSTKSIINYTMVAKLIVASAVNAEGEQLHPRKWNHDFIGMPILKRETQHRPSVTEADLREILASSNKRYALLFALLAGSGLRIGEALALKLTDFSSDCRMLHVRRSIWQGREQAPKTPNAVRVIDIPEPLAQLLRELVAVKPGYLFAAKSGRPLQQRNVLRALHATGTKVGLHAFRRFRTETLRRARVPEDLTRLWLGHSKQSVTDFYAGGLEKDEAWRRDWCERAGVGFSLVGLLGLQKQRHLEPAEAA
jgi:integrase